MLSTYGGPVKKNILYGIFATLFLINGCANKAIEKNLAEKVSDEPTVSGSFELQNDANYLIENSNLTTTEKSQLKTLQANTNKSMESLRDESLKLRSILIKDVFSPHYNYSEVALIQEKIEKVEHKRVALIFDTIDKANGIFGRETNEQEKEHLMSRMFYGHENQ